MISLSILSSIWVPIDIIIELIKNLIEITYINKTGNQLGHGFKSLLIVTDISFQISLRSTVEAIYLHVLKVSALIRMEKVDIRSLRGIVKILGTIFCVGGAISMALLKGPKLLNTEILPPSIAATGTGDNWPLGCLYLFGCCCFWSFWVIMQVFANRIHLNYSFFDH
jgi:hypothetical protein